MSESQEGAFEEAEDIDPGQSFKAIARDQELPVIVPDDKPSSGPTAAGTGDDTSTPPQPVTETFLNSILEQITKASPRRYVDSSSGQHCTIYEAPPEFKDKGVVAPLGPPYGPIAVSIGPFYHDWSGEATCLKQLEEYKLCFARELIGRHGLLPTPTSMPMLLRRCLERLKGLEERIRASYSGDIVFKGMGSEELVKMMLFDGCFVLRLLLKHAAVARRAKGRSGGEEEADEFGLVLGRCWIWELVTYDLLLLENQIPFFVVRALFDVLKTNPAMSDDDLVTGALQLFSFLHPRRSPSFKIRCDEVHHLLHLFYRSILPPPASPVPYSTTINLREDDEIPPELTQWVPSAKELEEAGVQVKAAGKDAASFLYVRFRDGAIEMPTLQLQDYSELLFRNLIAFEQAYPETYCHITVFASFMDCLITAPVDMRLLQKNGVLVNQMDTGRDATRFFSDLCAHVHYNDNRNYLKYVLADVNRYRLSTWPQWRAELVHNYFSNPWVTSSVIAAGFLLLLSVVQTFYAVYAYHKPPR